MRANNNTLKFAFAIMAVAVLASGCRTKKPTEGDGYVDPRDTLSPMDLNSGWETSDSEYPLSSGWRAEDLVRADVAAEVGFFRRQDARDRDRTFAELFG